MKIDFLDGFEETLEEWYKSIPNLPKGFTKWLAKWAWLLVLIGAIIMIFAVLGWFAILVDGPASGSDIFGYKTVDYALVGWIALVALATYVVFSFKAVSPLKSKSMEGWKMLFYLEFLYILFSILQWLSSPSYISDFIATLVGAAIGFYFLFQIKKHFN